jgi:hypothetical protein
MGLVNCDRNLISTRVTKNADVRASEVIEDRTGLFVTVEVGANAKFKRRREESVPRSATPINSCDSLGDDYRSIPVIDG